MFHKTVHKVETSSNVQNSYQKILQKFSFHKSRSIEQESNTNWNRQRLHDNLLHPFDRLNKSFDQSNILNFEFHLENSRIWIFTLFILQMNTLQPYIIITIYPYIYLYIQHIYPWNSALGSNKRDEPHTRVTPWGLPLMWDCESP